MRFEIILFSILILLLTISSCEKRKEEIKTKNQLISYLDSLELEYENACVQMGLANWNLYSGSGKADLDQAKQQFSEIFLNKSIQKLIEEWRARSSSLADDTLSRRLELWWRCFLGGQIYSDSIIAVKENNLQKKITNFKFKYYDETITLAEINNRLRKEKNPKIRQKLWNVVSQLSAEAKDDLIELVKLRNERAKSLGFYNFYSLSLYLQQIDEEWLIKTLNSLEEQTNRKFQEFIDASKKKYRVKIIYPWDFDAIIYNWASISDTHFPKDSIFHILHKFHDNIGFKTDSLPIKELIRNIPFGGLNIGIKIPDDSRFILNPIDGIRFYQVAFHEYGHALQVVNTKIKYPILKGYEWIPGASCGAYSEGIAELQAQFVTDPEWLKRYTNATQDEIDKYIATKSFGEIYALRKTLKNFFFEYEMYKAPDQDLDSLEKAMFKKYLLVDIPNKTPHRFAASIWYTMYPCYYQNYILSEMIASQLYEVIVNKFGEKRIDNPDVSSWITSSLYANGEMEEWYIRIKNASGKSLETGAYLRRLNVIE